MGGFAVCSDAPDGGSPSDGEASPLIVSPSRFATYAACPRQYEYDKVWDVSTPEQPRRYLDRGLVYHGVIEDTCTHIAANPELSDGEIRQFVTEQLDDRWQTETDRSAYRSEAQYNYERQVVESGLASYFTDEGIEHVRNSIGTEVWLECERDGVHLRGRADNIVQTDAGLQIIDYKGSLNGIITRQSADSIEAHHSGEEYDPSRLKSVFQAATYIEGAKELDAFENGSEIEFTFYGLLQKKERTRGLDGITVTASGYGRDVGDIYRSFKEPIWALITDYYEGITNGDFEPARWEEIRENTCGDCTYQSMCGDYLTAEVHLDE